MTSGIFFFRLLLFLASQIFGFTPTTGWLFSIIDWSAALFLRWRRRRNCATTPTIRRGPTMKATRIILLLPPSDDSLAPETVILLPPSDGSLVLERVEPGGIIGPSSQPWYHVLSSVLRRTPGMQFPSQILKILTGFSGAQMAFSWQRSVPLKVSQTQT